MTSDTSTTRGRPRSEDRTSAILETTIELLHDMGFDNLRMQDVADRAGVGLATIYRRWPAKPDLVAAAMDCKPGPEVELTGDVDVDLRSTLEWLATEMGTQGEYMAGLMTATNQHEVMACAVRGSIRSSMRDSLGALLERKMGSAHHLDLVTDAIPGVLMYRCGLMGEGVDPEAFADEVIGLVEALG